MLLALITFIHSGTSASADDLIKNFQSPPRSARPGVYWYFMDGNLDRDEMVKDLESMKEAGLGNLVFLEVDVGVPRGPVKFMSDQWQELFANAVRHAERLGIDITLGAGPGWTGSGGPWVKAGAVDAAPGLQRRWNAKGPADFDDVLPVPGTAKHPLAQDAQSLLRGCGRLRLPEVRPGDRRHRREGAVRAGSLHLDARRQTLPACPGELPGTGRVRRDRSRQR